MQIDTCAWKARLLFLGSLFVAVSVLSGHPKTARSTEDFSDVYDEAIRLGDIYGPENVLLVFDIDNTLLAMRRGLGSDQWYGWQTGMDATDPQRVGDFTAVLDVQGLLYAASSMRPTSEDQPAMVKSLQEKGFPALMLTSRGYTFRDSTRRELEKNGYGFQTSAPQPYSENAIGFIAPYFPYGETPVEEAGLSPEEVAFWLKREDGSLRRPRLVSYSEGIYMTAGQNKGLMLRLLLERLGRTGEYDAIVFADDLKKHTERMQRAFRDDSTIQLTTFHYRAEDHVVEAFMENANGALDTAANDWERLWSLLNEVVEPTFELPDYQPAEAVLID